MFRFLIDCWDRSKTTYRRVFDTEKRLADLGFYRGVDYSGISVASGISGGLGVELFGIAENRMPELARALLRPVSDARLVYARPGKMTLFCGESYADDAALEARVRNLQRQLRHEGLSASTDPDAAMRLELRLRESVGVRTGQLGLEVDVDEQGASIDVQGIGNESLACELQRKLIRDFSEFGLSARFRFEGAWHIHMEEFVPMT